jgi:hypothetical protein
VCIVEIATKLLHYVAQFHLCWTVVRLFPAAEHAWRRSASVLVKTVSIMTSSHYSQRSLFSSREGGGVCHRPSRAFTTNGFSKQSMKKKSMKKRRRNAALQPASQIASGDAVTLHGTEWRLGYGGF